MALQVVPPSRTACPRLPSGRVTPPERVGMPGESEGACPVLPCLSLFAAISSERKRSRASASHPLRTRASMPLSGTEIVRLGGSAAQAPSLRHSARAAEKTPIPHGHPVNRIRVDRLTLRRIRFSLFTELKRGLRMAALLAPAEKIDHFRVRRTGCTTVHARHDPHGQVPTSRPICERARAPARPRPATRRPLRRAGRPAGAHDALAC
jgi:hypothetical protein